MTPPPSDSELDRVVHRNIAALLELRAQHEGRKTLGDRIADRVAGWAGTVTSAAVHAALFGGWIAVNTGLVPGVPPVDPPPFVMLAMVASVEAIFLSTFILVSQNRLEEHASRRADLDLQISLLAEHEITRLIRLTDAIAAHLGVAREDVEHLDELKRDVRPEAVLGEMERAERRAPPHDSVSPS